MIMEIYAEKSADAVVSGCSDVIRLQNRKAGVIAILISDVFLF